MLANSILLDFTFDSSFLLSALFLVQADLILDLLQLRQF